LDGRSSPFINLSTDTHTLPDDASHMIRISSPPPTIDAIDVRMVCHAMELLAGAIAKSAGILREERASGVATSTYYVIESCSRVPRLAHAVLL
jgi:hypothetical protein